MNNLKYYEIKVDTIAPYTDDYAPNQVRVIAHNEEVAHLLALIRHTSLIDGSLYLDGRTFTPRDFVNYTCTTLECTEADLLTYFEVHTHYNNLVDYLTTYRTQFTKEHIQLLIKYSYKLLSILNTVVGTTEHLNYLVTPFKHDFVVGTGSDDGRVTEIYWRCVTYTISTEMLMMQLNLHKDMLEKHDGRRGQYNYEIINSEECKEKLTSERVYTIIDDYTNYLLTQENLTSYAISNCLQQCHNLFEYYNKQN